MVLFAQQALIVDHGLRSNNMEAPLVLAYCGGMYHALAWSATTTRRARALHPQAVAAYFVLGFMTKFVAVAFLPLVIAIVALTHRAWRRRLREDWKWWTIAAAVATALIVPWFAHQTWEWGTALWDVILGEHVVERMRVSIDPGHIRPWHFYWTRTVDEILANGTAPLIVVGLALLSWRTFQRRWDAGALMLAWLIVPLVIISAGRGKLYHYVYPFLPPLAIAAGYGAVALFESASPVRRQLEAAAGWLSARLAFLGGRRRAALRAALIGIAVVSVAVALWTVLVGRFALRLGDVVLFRNRSVVRPMAAAALALVLAGSSRQAAHVVLALLVIGSLGGYARSLRRLDDGQAQLQRLRACLRATISRPDRGASLRAWRPGTMALRLLLPAAWLDE